MCCLSTLYAKWWITAVPGASWFAGRVDKPQAEHDAAPATPLPRPSQVLRYDGVVAAASAPSPGRVVSWNVHLGLDLAGCVRELRALAADIVVLQEDNVFRSGARFRHAGGAIAVGLGMHAAFAPSYYRSDGCYGACVLSRAPIERAVALRARVRPKLVRALPGRSAAAGSTCTSRRSCGPACAWPWSRCTYRRSAALPRSWRCWTTCAHRPRRWPPSFR